MRINSKRKGKVGELQIAKILREAGYTDARRGVQYEGGSSSADVIGLPGFHIEVKFCKLFDGYNWMEQAKRDADLDTPVVVWRKDKKQWMVLMELDEFLTVLKSRGNIP
jgi:hypothetical protein